MFKGAEPNPDFDRCFMKITDFTFGFTINSD